MKPKPILQTRGYDRPPLARQLARYLDKQITACQEWLEGPDKPPARLVARVLLSISAVYLAAQVVLWLWRGG